MKNKFLKTLGVAVLVGTTVGCVKYFIDKNKKEKEVCENEETDEIDLFEDDLDFDDDDYDDCCECDDILVNEGTQEPPTNV